MYCFTMASVIAHIIVIILVLFIILVILFMPGSSGDPYKDVPLFFCILNLKDEYAKNVLKIREEAAQKLRDMMDDSLK